MLQVPILKNPSKNGVDSDTQSQGKQRDLHLLLELFQMLLLIQHPGLPGRQPADEAALVRGRTRLPKGLRRPSQRRSTRSRESNVHGALQVAGGARRCASKSDARDQPTRQRS